MHYGTAQLITYWWIINISFDVKTVRANIDYILIRVINKLGKLTAGHQYKYH